jgi:hypothetical protein
MNPRVCEDSEDYELGYSTGMDLAKKDPCMGSLELFYLSMFSYKHLLRSVILQRPGYTLGFKLGYRDMVAGII